MLDLHITVLKKIQNWNSMPYKERSLYNVLNEIKSRCGNANIKKQRR